MAKPALSGLLQPHRERFFALLAALGMSATVIALATMVHFLASFRLQPSANNATETHTGRIVFQSAQNTCLQILFDNDTGKTVGTPTSCSDQAPMDANGRAAPQDFDHHLNAISKSFSGR